MREMAKSFSKLGLFCAPTGEIVFENVKLPKDGLVGKKGDGFRICIGMLDHTRLSSAARAVGVARASSSIPFDMPMNASNLGCR